LKYLLEKQGKEIEYTTLEMAEYLQPVGNKLTVAGGGGETFSHTDTEWSVSLAIFQMEKHNTHVFEMKMTS
jgi:hypothetical protein